MILSRYTGPPNQSAAPFFNTYSPVERAVRCLSGPRPETLNEVVLEDTFPPSLETVSLKDNFFLSAAFPGIDPPVSFFTTFGGLTSPPVNLRLIGGPAVGLGSGFFGSPVILGA